MTPDQEPITTDDFLTPDDVAIAVLAVVFCALIAFGVIT